MKTFTIAVIIVCLLPACLDNEDLSISWEALIESCNWQALPFQTDIGATDFEAQLSGTWHSSQRDCSNAFTTPDNHCTPIDRSEQDVYSFLPDNRVAVTHGILGLEEELLDYQLEAARAGEGFEIVITIPEPVQANGGDPEIRLYWRAIVENSLAIDDPSAVVADVCRVLYVKDQ